MDLAQPPGLHLVDEAPHVVLVGDERARLDAPHRLAHVLLEVRKRLQGEPGLDPHLLLDLLLELVVGEGEHAAVGVVDEDDLAGAQEALGDGKRADLVVGYDAPGVADDVGVAFLEPEHPVDVQASVRGTG